MWETAWPLGYLDSVQAAGSVAAPLLAGASFTLAALVLQAVKPFARWPDASLLCFVGAGLALIVTVQAVVWARRYTVSPGELAERFPAQVADGIPSEWLLRVQRHHVGRARVWSRLARWAYHIGILLLLAGVAISVIPPRHVPATRWAVIGLACLGVLGEAAWIAWSYFRYPGPATARTPPATGGLSEN